MTRYEQNIQWLENELNDLHYADMSLSWDLVACENGSFAHDKIIDLRHKVLYMIKSMRDELNDKT